MTDLSEKARTRKLYYALSILFFLLFPMICQFCGDGNLPPQKSFARFWINLIFLNALWAYAMIFIAKGAAPTLSWKEWALFAMAGIFLCTTPPVFSGDLHEYLMRGRILGVYHENPYLVPKNYPEDPFYQLTVWVAQHKLPENYGPVWACLQWIAPTLFQKSYIASIFFFKFILFLFLAGSVWIFDLICRKAAPEKAAWMVPFFALNPNLIDHTLIDGHNDIVMVFFILCSFYLLLKGYYYRAVAAGTLAVLIKFTAVILLPIAGIFYFRRQSIQSIAVFCVLVLKSLLLFLGICALFYLPFWVGPSTLGYFSKFGDWFATNSVPYAIRLFLTYLGANVSESAVKHFFVLFFAANCLAAFLWISFKEKPNLKHYCRAISWIFLAMYASYTIPFYGHHLLWAFPFLILSELPAPLFWNVLYTVVGLFFYFKRPSFLFLIGFSIYMSYLLIRYFQRNQSPKGFGPDPLSAELLNK